VAHTAACYPASFRSFPSSGFRCFKSRHKGDDLAAIVRKACRRASGSGVRRPAAGGAPLSGQQGTRRLHFKPCETIGPLIVGWIAQDRQQNMLQKSGASVNNT
jgi:hypothetical protein